MPVRRRKAGGKSGIAAEKNGKSSMPSKASSSSSSSPTPGASQQQHPRKRPVILWSLIAVSTIAVGVTVAVIVSLQQRSNNANAVTATTTRQQRFTSHGTFEVIETVPHNISSFTQGFCIHNGTLYEGTGLYGNSVVQIVDLQTGSTLQQRPIPDQYFGEGLAYYEHGGKGRLVQLTWREKTGFVYDSETLEVLQKFNYSTYTSEGWGITRRKGKSFVVSDGSEFLFSWDDSFTETSRVKVTWLREDMAEPRSFTNINELEWDPFTDTILANLWYSDYILRIDPLTGFSTTVYDMTSLYPKDQRQPTSDCLNGIAVTGTPNVIWVTGKQWPNMHKIRLIDYR